MKTLILSLIGLVFFGFTETRAALQSQLVDYKHGDTLLEGYLVYDDAVKGMRPGILVVHEWWGLNDYAKKRADQLAGLGYIAFAVDMYGKGLVAKTAQEAGQLSRIYSSDRAFMRARVKAGLAVLEKQPLTDTKRIAAIGYCFGGATVLELARSGAALSGVVSFHGTLNTPNLDDAKNIRCKVLVLTGADDPAVPTGQVFAFQEEMRKAGIDWYLISYGHAVHAFTNPQAGHDPAKGAAYNEKADKRSWEAMRAFFNEIFQ